MGCGEVGEQKECEKEDTKLLHVNRSSHSKPPARP